MHGCNVSIDVVTVTTVTGCLIVFVFNELTHYSLSECHVDHHDDSTLCRSLVQDCHILLLQ